MRVGGVPPVPQRRASPRFWLRVARGRRQALIESYRLQYPSRQSSSTEVGGILPRGIGGAGAWDPSELGCIYLGSHRLYPVTELSRWVEQHTERHD
jgi:hypothetical protein